MIASFDKNEDGKVEMAEVNGVTPGVSHSLHTCTSVATDARINSSCRTNRQRRT
jgi:hypothetical protein